jgi:hypothetical protein
MSSNSHNQSCLSFHKLAAAYLTTIILIYKIVYFCLVPLVSFDDFSFSDIPQLDLVIASVGTCHHVILLKVD